jgi:hypothetical protein
MQARSKRTEITADRVVVELAKIAFANVLDYWPRPGEGIHLHWPDRTAAVQELTVVEAVECCIAEPASRCMRGGGVDEPGAASRDVRRSPRRRGQLRAPGHKDDSAERVACAEQLLESARKYLPAFEEWETNRSQEG